MSRFRLRAAVAASALLAPVLAALPATPAHAVLPGTYISGSYTNAYGTRTWTGYVPSTYRAGTAVPLVVGLHGCTQQGDNLRQLTRLDQSAEANGYIVVFPNQSGFANGSLCWNWFLTSNQSRGRGEPSIIAGITNQIKSSYTVDSHRTFVLGVSAGAAMSVIMGATYPDIYAAIGSGAGCEYGGYPCGSSGGPDPVTQGQKAYQAMGTYHRVVPVIAFQGSADTTVYPINGTQLVQQWISTDDYADDGSHNGSVPTTVNSTTDGVSPGGETYTVSHYVDNGGGNLIDYWYVNGMGHAWGGGCTCQAFADPNGPDETAAMWSFFAAHPKP